MRITEEEMAERKYKILHVAYHLFCQHGIDAITLSQIAKESGVSNSTVYRYFETKAELLLQTQNILWTETVAQVTKNNWNQLPLSKNGWEELSILLYGFKAFYQQHSNYLLFSVDYKLFLVRNCIRLSEYSYNKTLKPVKDIFCAALNRGQNDGSINRESPAETQFIEIWDLIRGFAEQLVVLNAIYEKPNLGEQQFDHIIQYILETLRGQTN